MYLVQREDYSGCIAPIKKVAQVMKTMKQRHKIASDTKNIKSSVGEIKERSVRYKFTAENGQGSSKGTTGNECFGDLRMASHFIEETQVVGFESPRDELVSCLVEGTNELMLATVVGMGGLGKTTLSKHTKLVKKHFDCRCFITVSQSYNMKELLINMVKKFCKDINGPTPKGLQEMDGITLIAQVREYLESKRYLISVFL